MSNTGPWPKGSWWQLGDVQVRALELHHPGASLGYRVDFEGHSVVYATDIEHGSPVDARLADFARGTDVLIYDAMYTPEEYSGSPGKVGWGHSTWEAAVQAAQAADARTLVLFHHDPERDDAALRALERRAQRKRPGTLAAREGMTLSVGPSVRAAVRSRAPQRRPCPSGAVAPPPAPQRQGGDPEPDVARSTALRSPAKGSRRSASVTGSQAYSTCSGPSWTSAPPCHAAAKASSTATNRRARLAQGEGVPVVERTDREGAPRLLQGLTAGGRGAGLAALAPAGDQLPEAPLRRRAQEQEHLRLAVGFSSDSHAHRLDVGPGLLDGRTPRRRHRRGRGPSPQPPKEGAVPSSCSIDVTPASAMPQGTMSSKSARGPRTLRAKPCVVTHRAMWTPSAAIFLASRPSAPSHTPGQRGIRPASSPKPLKCNG